LGRPWDLQSALSHPRAVKPGDTLWLRGGKYEGSFISSLVGAPAAPIIVRTYPGERVTIDSSRVTDTINAALRIEGSDTWFWGLEIVDTRTDRSSRRPTGVNMRGPRTKLINCILHDGGDEVGFAVPAVDAEVYGCIIYNNGWIETGLADGGFTGHGVYMQNDTGTKRLIDNVIFGSFGYGIHAYAEAIPMQGFYLEGNTVIGRAFLVGAQQPLNNVSIIRNFTYMSEITLGYGNNNLTATITGNYAYGSIALKLDRWATLTVTDNTLVNQRTGGGACLVLTDPPGAFSYSFDRNTCYRGESSNEMWVRYLQNGALKSFLFSGWRSLGYDLNGSYHSDRDIDRATKPSSNKVFIRANQYEPARAQIVVYNWELKKAVSVDLSGVLHSGTAYEIRNAQDYFGPPILTGTYDGKLVTLPMDNLSFAAPIGKTSLSRRPRPEFNVFVLIARTTPSAVSKD
jgi:hypothetical protein